MLAIIKDLRASDKRDSKIDDREGLRAGDRS